MFFKKDRIITLGETTISVWSLMSYVVDWTSYIIIAIIAILYGSFVPPRFHEFFLQDPQLMHTYYPENQTAIPIWLLIILAIIIPIMGILVFSTIPPYYSLQGKFWNIHSGMLALSGAMSIQLFIVCIIKNVVGLPRPDILHRCQSSILATPSGTLADVSICTNPVFSLIEEGFRTFPSGHSSTVFAGNTILSLFIAGRLRLLDKRGASFKFLFFLFPLIVASVVAFTRISDNRHFIIDVIFGALIGSIIGITLYFQYFPSLCDLSSCTRAHPPRRIGQSRLFEDDNFWRIYGSTETNSS